MKARSMQYHCASLVFYGFLLVGALLCIIPFVWMILTSFKYPDEVISYPPTFWPRDPHWGNFRKVFQMLPFGRFYLNSLIIGIIATASTLFFSSLGGYAFAKLRFPGRDLIFYGIVSTMMIPFFVIIIPLYVLIVDLEWVDTYMGILLPQIMSAFGIFMLRQFIMSVPSALMDAARIDGAGEFRIYSRIILPLCKPAMGTLGIFHFMYSWDNFLWPLLVTNSDSMKTLPLGLGMFSSQYTTEYHLMMAASTLAVVPVLIVFLLFQRHIVSGITLSGMKA